MTRLKDWLPALAMMGLIFTASSIPGDAMPSFERFDFSVKKLGHAVGYALLAISYLRGLKSSNREDRQGKTALLVFFAWLMAVLFAISDEFHQHFTPGRNPSVWDVLVYDNFGAIIGLLIFNRFDKSKQKDGAPAPPSADS